MFDCDTWTTVQVHPAQHCTPSSCRAFPSACCRVIGQGAYVRSMQSCTLKLPSRQLKGDLNESHTSAAQEACSKVNSMRPASIYILTTVQSQDRRSNRSSGVNLSQMRVGPWWALARVYGESGHREPRPRNSLLERRRSPHCEENAEYPQSAEIYSPQFRHPYQTSNWGSIKMRGVICGLACIALIQSSAAFDWKQCEGASGKIDDVSLKPETPAPGTTVTFSIDATVGTCKSLFRAQRPCP